jgi:hypothetical protein
MQWFLQRILGMTCGAGDVYWEGWAETYTYPIPMVLSMTQWRRGKEPNTEQK